MAAAARRLAVLFAVLGVGIAAVSLVVGALAGAGVMRSLSLGYVLVGAALLIVGFFVGMRGPMRLSADQVAGMPGGARLVRWASPDERVETINASALLVVVGFVLVVVGLAFDPRYALF